MRFVPISCEEREEMLRAVGSSDIDDLFSSIPAEVRLGRPLAIANGMTEMEVAGRMRALADANIPASRLISFAGAGCYDHYVPAIVDHMLRKPEFFTAYTPYQPEVSQGTLQNIYEFQTMVCELFGMDVANASMYDGATAFTEGALMAARVTKRRRVLVSYTVHPAWRQVLDTYAAAGTIEVVTVPPDGPGHTSMQALQGLIDDTAAAVLVSSPAFLGSLEDVRGLADAAHSVGALLVVATNPILAGVLESPGAQGADIVVGEGQVLGGAMSFGGPGLGLFACRMEHLRQMPGRVVGRTVDVDGNMAFVLTMQTREQHIRREKATSNICSNHALNALAAAVYLEAVGVEGLRALGHACVSKAHYLHDSLVATGRFATSGTPFANEFALTFQHPAAWMRDRLLAKGFLACVPMCEVVPGAAPAMAIFAVTEKRTRAEMDAFVEAVVAL
ncbi:MAG TPA: aminomethyl-transferring glycine dehydrogenase subunit GcvPA [Coriobacteriia bacterium]